MTSFSYVADADAVRAPSTLHHWYAASVFLAAAIAVVALPAVRRVAPMAAAFLPVATAAEVEWPEAMTKDDDGVDAFESGSSGGSGGRNDNEQFGGVPADDGCGVWEVPFRLEVPPRRGILDASGPFDASEYLREAQASTERRLHRVLRDYRNNASSMLRSLSLEYEVALRSEEVLFPHLFGDDDDDIGGGGSRRRAKRREALLSSGLERKVGKFAASLEKNSLALERLLKPIPLEVTRTVTAEEYLPAMRKTRTPRLQSAVSKLEDDDRHRCRLAWYIPPHDTSKGDSRRTWSVYGDNNEDGGGGNGDENEDEGGYDTALQVVAHVARDWTSGGRPVREATHGWISDRLLEWHRCGDGRGAVDADTSLCLPAVADVLVPGAGLGRLAFDIATATYGDECGGGDDIDDVSDDAESNCRRRPYHPFAAEANDSSMVMATAARSILTDIPLELLRSNEPPSGNDDVDDDAEGCDASSSGKDEKKEVGRRSFAIHPFASDPLTNEVDPDRRFDAAEFPDDEAIGAFRRIYQSHDDEMRQRGRQRPHPGNESESFDASMASGTTGDESPAANSLRSTHNPLPNMSYTVGDFVTTYASSRKRNQYDAVTTSFFVDTASNVYEYVAAIKNALRTDDDDGSSEGENEDYDTSSGPGSEGRTRRKSCIEEGGGGGGGGRRQKRGRGSVWINVGPVQWHKNAQLRPSAEEFRGIIEAAGFVVKIWEVTNELVGYRHPDDAGPSSSEEEAFPPRYTRSDAYRPLRFVAVLGGGRGRDGHDDDDGAEAGGPASRRCILHESENDRAPMDEQQHRGGDDDGGLLRSIDHLRHLTGRRTVFDHPGVTIVDNSVRWEDLDNDRDDCGDGNVVEIMGES